ncbi:MFS transporter [Solimicrobium silvestre]|uniref:Major Facilitator Superfamily n=1 Tax=Solimicrobium silvestre TaxID=2099400 RepID=A0A2S9H5C6_9BURK|nr:MFS transporter [Solimicrobium silvestre]PRC95189.1 Major Facilitator Superfamily [Solimicrobium silvestre]
MQTKLKMPLNDDIANYAKKPMLSFWQIWNMSFGFLGIQFGFALQNSNVSRIFETLGAKIDDLPILWIAAPCTGLLIQPLIGFLSDRTWNRFGRRRPYFLIGAILASLALIAMPNSKALWVATVILWILDSSINISMEPFRAFVGDMLPQKQLTNGFAFQSFFIGIGAVVASALPYMLSNWFHVENSALPGHLPDSVVYSFYLGAIAFLSAVVWTVIKTKEYSPQELRQQDPEAWKNIDSEKQPSWLSIFSDFRHMPKTMVQLAFVQFFTWFALFAMWIYTTSAVTKHIYHSVDPSTALYNDGANWVGVCFAVYNGFSAIFAFALPWLAKRTSRKMTHAISLIVGGCSLISIYFVTTPEMLIVSMMGIGMAWASILSMPYAILAGALPANKMGLYMGTFNFFIVIPQILAASILGFFTKNLFHGEAVLTLALGGFSMLVAAALVMNVQDKNG